MKLGLPPAQSGTSNIIDDLALKQFLSDIPKRKRKFIKADVGDAYLKAKRKERGKAYMDMPALVKEYDADGTEMVVEFNTPTSGARKRRASNGTRSSTRRCSTSGGSSARA